ncbi:amino acid--tRNA ligase-related protein, partial [Saccharothrix sp. ST-888]|uniref:amino acid--tRNA ligase-related protein n=1 Tax=Saccharothrix sp. ST-888 TaxID=1427391 RepID=UPI0005ED0212
VAEKWDLVIFGTEIGTAYSELVDPVEQRARLTDQARLAAGGDAEAMNVAEDFLRPLAYAMLHPVGLGRGLHSLTVTLTVNTIRATSLSALVKPHPVGAAAMSAN